MRRQVVVVGLALEVAVEPVHRPVAAVGLGHRVDEHDHAVADRADERRLGDGQPVGQLHQHLRRSRLGGVQAAVEHVERLARRHDPLHGRLVASGAGSARSAMSRADAVEVGRGSSRRPRTRAGSRGPPRSCRSSRPSPAAWPRPARGSRRRSSSCASAPRARPRCGRGASWATARSRIVGQVGHPGREEARLGGGGGDRLAGPGSGVSAAGSCAVTKRRGAAAASVVERDMEPPFTGHASVTERKETR